MPGEFFNTWEDARLEALIRRIERTVDRGERAAMYREIHRLMFAEPPFIYLYQPIIFEAVRHNVEGYAPRAAEEYFLKSVSLRD